MNDENSVAGLKGKLEQIQNWLEESQAQFAAVPEALEAGAGQLRAAAEGSHRTDGTEAATALLRALEDAKEVASELASAIKETNQYKNFI